MVRFGGLTAVDHMALAVQEGEIIGLIGPNGAGKSTLLNAVSRLVPAEGHVTLHRRDRDPVDLLTVPPWTVVRHGVARTFQHPQLAPDLTVAANMGLGLFARSRTSWLAAGLRLPSVRAEERRVQEDVVRTAEFLGVAQWLDQLPGSLPYGIQKLVELGRAILAHPVLLLLDEPAAGLNSAEKAVMQRLLLEVRQAYGLSMIVVDHDMEFIFGLSDRIYAMNFGTLLASGTPDAIRGNAAVQEAYLGQEDDR